MNLKKTFTATLKSKSLFIPEEGWEYLEDPTYQTSSGSMVCLTCDKFSFRRDESFGSILYCDLHNKLIFHGEHLTHSCELYKKTIYSKKINHNKNK